MSQESVAQETSARVRGRVASTHKHDALERHPLLVRRAVETILLSHLSQESDDWNGSILIGLGQVDLITEHNQPFACLSRHHEQP